MRKLATASIAFSAAVYAANYILASGWLIPIAVLSAVTGAALALLRKKALYRAAIVLLFAAAGLLCFFFHSRSTVEKAAEYDGQIHVVNARVLQYPDVYDDYARLEVRVTSGYLPGFKAVLYDNEMQLCDARPGDTIELRARISTADSLFDKSYDGYHSKGIYFKLSSRGSAELNKSFNIFCLPQYVSHWLSARIEKMFPDDTNVFMRSLMLGDKDGFYEDTALYSAVSRAGLMHIVAVSGMHISFLVGLLHFVFGQGRRSAVICIVLVWFFALVTGAGPSVLRASFMYTTILMAPVLRRENDPITSLSAILALILCVNPFAAASISLQLSFGAMAGIVCFSGKIYHAMAAKLKRLAQCGLVRHILASIACSLSVMVFTTPLTALHFGTVPLLSPLTNLISLWAVAYCFCGGWISCALSWIPIAGEVCAWLCSWLARYIFLAAELVSSVPFAVLYMETRGAWLWMAVSYAVFAVLCLCRLKAFTVLAASVLFSAVFVSALLWGNKQHYADMHNIRVLNVGQGQCISVLTDEASIIVDCGNISSIEDAGMMAAEYLYSRGRDSVDALVISHYHEDHANGAAMLMDLVDVDTVIMPLRYDDRELYEEIVDCAERNGTKIIRIIRDEEFRIGDVDIELYSCGRGEDENERGLITMIDLEGNQLLVMADSSAEMERKLAADHDLSFVDAFVVSHHGSKYSSTDELLSEIGGSIAIISVGNNYYGHPAEETLEALESYGYNVYRTDLNDYVELEAGNDDG